MPLLLSINSNFKTKMKLLKILGLLFFINFLPLFAKVGIEFGESLNYINYPNLSIKLKVTKDGRPVEISSTQLVILEGNYPLMPSSISNPDLLGYQLVSWTSTSPNSEIPWFFVTVENEVGIAVPDKITQHPIYDKPSSYIKFVDNDRNVIKEIRFGNVQVGDYTSQRINVVSAIQKSSGSILYPSKVDWVGTSSDEFKYLWLGSSINNNIPPVEIISPFPYAIEVLYIPKDNRYKREYLTISYDNGRQSHIAMVANYFPIYKKTQLKLLKPETKEILFPCQQYQISWKGNKLDVPVQLEFTTNKGKNWEVIETLNGTSYTWSIPNIETDSLFIRVSQNFLPPSERALSTKANQPQKIAFSKDGTKILSATKDGKLTEVDIRTKTELKAIPFANIDFPFEKANITSLSYFNNDSFAVVSYRWSDFYGYEKNDTLVVVDLYNQQIVRRILLNEGEKLKKFVVDENNNRLILLKEFQNYLEIYNFEDFNFQQSILFEAPVNEIAIKDTLIAVALLSNKIQLLSSKDFTLINEIEIKYQPYITNLAISNEGSFIAYTTKKDSIKDVLENLSDAYVIDVKTKKIVRALYNNWSDAIGIEFSPTDNHLVLGFENNPSIVIWDLVNDVKSAEIFGSGYNITDFKVSNESFIIASAEPERNLVIIRDFNFPEATIFGPFKIHKPKLQANEMIFPAQKIYYKTIYQFENKICNIGDVPFIIQNAYFVSGRNFSLERNINGDSIEIANCYPINIVYNPRDTGDFVDTLVIVSCGEKYFVPFRGKGINRDFKFLHNLIDFGKVCIGESKEIELDLGYNNDTIQLPIDLVKIQSDGSKDFFVVEGFQYQVLSFGQRLKVKLKFQPTKLGPISSFIEVRYLGQWDYIFQIPVLGEGIGVELSLSTDDLRFISEIPTRDIIIKNLSSTDVIIDSLIFYPPGYFIVNPALQIPLPSNSAKILSITMIQPPPSDVSLTIYSSPCSAIKTITLGQYIGTTTLSLPIIETEPKGFIEIPIAFKNTENRPYNGKRFFDAEIILNPHMFLPISIESEYGVSSITKNQIIDNRRFVGFRIEGNFPSEGILAKIKGNVGLYESDTTQIEFNSSSTFWGKNVKVNYKNGLIRLIGLCGNRRIITAKEMIKDLKITPNPARDVISLSYFADKSGNIEIGIYDVLGNLLQKEVFFATQGLNFKNLDISKLTNGLYRLIISFEGYTTNIGFLVVKS